MRKVNAKTTPAITLAEANMRIARLSKETVTPRCTRERLDLPVDVDIRVSGEGQYRSLALIVDDLAVSGCSVHDYRQQVGNGIVRMGGIAGVWTHNEHRFKGYSRCVMENVLRWMYHEGYDVTMLFGITGFYPKYGFATAFPENTFHLSLRDAERATENRCRFVRFTHDHLPAVLAMYRKTNTGRTGVIVREQKIWRPFREGNPWGARAQAEVALDGGGRPVGYFVHNIERDPEIIEVGYSHTVVFPDLLRAMAELAWASRSEKIAFRLPEDDAFMQFCMPLGLHKEIDYRRDGGAMIRLINLSGTLRKLVPLLKTRVAGTGALSLRTNIGEVALRWSEGAMIVDQPIPKDDGVKLPQWALAQMIYGCYGAGSPAFAGIISGTARSRALLAQLFPALPHYHYIVDHF